MSNDLKSGNLILQVRCKNIDSNIIKSYFILFNNETNTYNIYSFIKKNFSSYSSKYTNPKDINTIIQFIYILLKDEQYKMEDNFVFYKLYELSTSCFKQLIDCKTTNYINIKDMITGGENKLSFLLEERNAIKLVKEDILINYMNMIRNISIMHKELKAIFIEYKNDLDKQDNIVATKQNTSVYCYDYPY